MAVAAVAPLAFAVLPAIVDPDDQAAADDAVAIFNERLTAAGWTSTGPFTQTDSAPEDEEDSEFGVCLGGFEHFLDYTDVHFEGETARAFSDEFELAGEDETDSAGYAGAVVLTAEESAVSVLDRLRHGARGRGDGAVHDGSTGRRRLRRGRTDAGDRRDQRVPSRDR